MAPKPAKRRADTAFQTHPSEDSDAISIQFPDKTTISIEDIP